MGQGVEQPPSSTNHTSGRRRTDLRTCMARAAAVATHLPHTSPHGGSQRDTPYTCRCRWSVLSVSSLFVRILRCMESAAAPDDGHVGLPYIPPLLFMMIMNSESNFRIVTRVCVYVRRRGPTTATWGRCTCWCRGGRGRRCSTTPPRSRARRSRRRSTAPTSWAGSAPRRRCEMPSNAIIVMYHVVLSSRHAMACHVMYVPDETVGGLGPALQVR